MAVKWDMRENESSHKYASVYSRLNECLECHHSYSTTKSQSSNDTFNKKEPKKPCEWLNQSILIDYQSRGNHQCWKIPWNLKKVTASYTDTSA